MDATTFDTTGKDEWCSIMQAVKATESELMSVYKFKSFFTFEAAKLRKLVNQFITSQKQMLEQAKFIDEQVSSVLLPKIKMSTLQDFVKWIEKVT